MLLSNTDAKLTTAIDPREARLKIQLVSVEINYVRTYFEYIVIDCSPVLS